MKGPAACGKHRRKMTNLTHQRHRIDSHCRPVGALFAQAVEDALSGTGLEILEIPLSPSRLWELLEACKT